MLVSTYKTGEELHALASKPDMKSGVGNLGPGFRYKRGQVWSFWMEDDPRFDDGINRIARYRCVDGGDKDSIWVKEEWNG